MDGFGEEKLNHLPQPAFEPRTGQAVISRYTDYVPPPPDVW